MAQRTPYSPSDTLKNLTARARPRDERERHSQLAEPGLSVDSDELGMKFLTDATQQANFEGRAPAEAESRSITAEAPSDDVLDNATFDATRDIWETTVALSTEHERLDGALMLHTSGDDDEDDADEAAVRRSELPAVDLTGDVVREASLFDQVDSEHDADTRSPDVLADDVGHHAQRSGIRRVFSRRI